MIGEVKATYNTVEYLSNKINSIGRELIVIKEQYRQKEVSLLKEKSMLESLLENIKKLNGIAGLDDNGNYPCRVCGSDADEDIEPNWFAPRRSFGCHKCDIFYRDEDMWNENNIPD